MEKSYKVSTLFTRLRDSEHGWEAHVLDLDVVTYGDTLRHAVEMALEASRIVIEDDLEMKRDPLDRRAEDEFWAQLKKLQIGTESKLQTLGEVVDDPETESVLNFVAVELWLDVMVQPARPESQVANARLVIDANLAAYAEKCA